MPSSILLIDYNFDWVLRDRFLNPRTRAGFLTLEEVASVCGELGADGLELMHPYWEDCTARQLKRMAAEAGLPLVCYIFHSDLIVPSGSRREAAERTFRLLDRTARDGRPAGHDRSGNRQAGVPPGRAAILGWWKDWRPVRPMHNPSASPWWPRTSTIRRFNPSWGGGANAPTSPAGSIPPPSA